MIIKSKNYYENHARKILANNIVYFRIKKNWSQEDFADELGTTPTYVSGLENAVYSIEKDIYEVELYKDFIVTKHLLSTIKSSNRMINVTGSIFADENGYDNCLLINDDKNVIEALNGNLFMLMGNKLITPPISEGCLNGVMRKQVLALARKIETLEVVEEPISPFDLQKADELFVTNVIKGIQPVTKYRKKEYETKVSKDLLLRLNAQIRFN